nr:LysE family transporter [Gilliamella apicola]
MAFMQGFLCNLLNPKATLFFLAIFTQMLDAESSMIDKLIIAFIIWIEAFFGGLLWCLFFKIKQYNGVILKFNLFSINYSVTF